VLKRFFCAVLLMVSGLSIPVLAQDARPAGYIMAYDLKGADAQAGTVVVRDGKELPPKLLMPLYDDDSVFIRNETSKVMLSLARDGNFVVSGKIMRKEVAGEMPSGDDGFDIIEQIAEILFGGGEDDSLSVLVAKGGDELHAPMAVRQRNYVLREGKPVQVTWTGGDGPFTVRIDQGQGGGKEVTQTTRMIEVPLTTISGNRFAVVVTDANKRRLRIAFGIRTAPPKAPEKVKARENSGEVEAVWLSAQQNGAWRFEAIRRLRALPGTEATRGIIAALEKGWMPK
jgi:hypothetical protein